MASPNASFTDIVTTTLQGYSGTIADNITNHNALLRQINRKGNKRVATGRSIVQELEYAENSTVMWYSGAETLDISPTETFTAAEFNYKQLAGNVTITGLEEIQNSGKEAIHNLLKSRIRNLEKSMTNTLAAALYADGTGSSSKEVGGLRLLVADVPTNTVGGISGSTHSWWRNVVYDFSDQSVTPGTSTIQHAMNRVWINTVRGADKADIITADATYYLYYLESLTPNQRFTDDKGAGVGFTNLVYQAAVPVIYDDQCPANHMFFLNTDYLFLRPAKGREFVPLGEKSSVNQDALVMPVVWAGNMTTSNRSLQAVITA
ncbi:MAG: phage major capsid protein [Hyphomicrobiales bacterium]|nr:phage major capsid protein [Hyphomicrobiales bacterium]